MNTKYGLNQENKIFIFDKQIKWWIRSCVSAIMPFLSIYYYFLLAHARIKSNKSKKKYKFSICSIFKDESINLKEWIEYHLIIGVEHFYLYNNNSTDTYLKILEPYIDKGIVTLVEWNYPPPQQFPAYRNFHDNYWEETQWVAFIDLDEYICPIRETDIKKWIRKFDGYPSVVAYWKQFGTSGQIHHDNAKLVCEQYTICWDKYFAIGKTFFNTDFAINDFSAKELHAMAGSTKLFGVKLSIPPINEFKKFIRYKRNSIGLFKSKDNFTIQINHYESKAFNKYIYNKIVRGDVNNFIRDLSTFYWSQQYNTSSDYKIFRFMTELKVKMGMAKEVEEFIKKNGSSTGFID